MEVGAMTLLSDEIYSLNPQRRCLRLDQPYGNLRRQPRPWAHGWLNPGFWNTKDGSHAQRGELTHEGQ